MRQSLPILVLVICVAIFAFGITELFKLRFEGGDVYPAYSSLRADPLGTMALYESLGKVPGISVKRDFSDSNQLPDEPGTVYLHLAATPGEWKWMPDDLYHEIKDFLFRGGRLVVAFYPQTTASRRYDYRDDFQSSTNSVKSATDDKSKGGKPVKKHKMNADDDEMDTDLEKEWGIHQSFDPLTQDENSYVPVTVKNQSDLALPDKLDWHSGMVFTNCAGSWRTIYARGSKPVVLERTFGQGSVVVASDSYFLSNEAMAGDRHAEFLAWLLGDRRNVVFDEAHLGIVQTSGVAALMRKYRLHGLAAALLILAGLFIWKNSVSLVPPADEQQRVDFVAGKGSSAAFVNLLRRSVSPSDLLAVCFREWKKNVATGGLVSSARLQQAEAILAAENSLSPRERDDAASYRKISEVLSNRTKKL